MATEQDTSMSGWTNETLKQFFTTVVNDMKDHYDRTLLESDLRHQQRFDAAEKALEYVQGNQDRILREMDLRYQQRFDASERAVQAALVAAEKAVQAALAAAEKAVQASLTSADKAIIKAEYAQQLHNEMQNQWRSTVNDLTKNIADRARHDAETLVTALSERMEVSIKSLTDKTDSAVTRLDKSEGRSGGTATNIATMLAVGAMIITLGIGVLNLMATRTPSIVPVPMPPSYSPRGGS